MSEQSLNFIDEVEDFTPCFSCDVNVGHIMFCGEGMMCTECYSKYSDLPEEVCFTDVVHDKENKQKVVLAIEKERDGQES